MAGSFTRARDQILRLCEGDPDARTQRLQVLAVLRRVIGFDAYVWLLTDPETSVGSAPLADVPCLPELPRLIRLKYLTTVNRWTSMITPVASLCQETGGDLARSLMWRDLLCQYQIGDIATSVYRDRFGCWAFSRPLAQAGGIPVRGGGTGVPEQHRRSAHRGAAAQPGRGLRGRPRW